MTDQNTNIEPVEPGAVEPSGSLTGVVCTVVGCVILSVFLQSYTHISWWKPWIICLPIGCLAGWLIALWRVFDLDSRGARIVICSILSWTVLVGGFYSFNFLISNPETSYYVDATIKDMHVGKHRRNGRPSIDKYKIIIKLPSGKEQDFEVSYSEYQKFHEGDTVPIWVEDGLFGVPVIKNLQLPDYDKIPEIKKSPKYRNRK